MFIKLYMCSVKIWDALRDLVSFFKKREKHPWRSVTCSKNAGKVNYKNTRTTSLTSFWGFHC